MNDEQTVEISSAATGVEARGIQAMLAAEGIDCTLMSNEDTAYPGVVDRGPWGIVIVPASQEAQARDLLAQWRTALPADMDEAWKQGPAPTVGGDTRKGPIKGGFPLFLAGLVVGAAAALGYTALTAPGAKAPSPPVAVAAADVDAGTKILHGWEPDDVDKDGVIDEWILYEADVIIEWHEDKNNDGKKDVWTYFKNGRAARSTSDTNYDGTVDEWTFNDDFGRLARVERDLNYDGKPDAWEDFAGGQFTGGKYDLDYDGKPDEWSFAVHGLVMERHWSTRGGGVVDKKTFYTNGIKQRERSDEDGDGSFEKETTFDRFGRVVPTPPADAGE